MLSRVKSIHIASSTITTARTFAHSHNLPYQPQPQPTFTLTQPSYYILYKTIRQQQQADS